MVEFDTGFHFHFLPYHVANATNCEPHELDRGISSGLSYFWPFNQGLICEVLGWHLAHAEGTMVAFLG